MTYTFADRFGNTVDCTFNVLVTEGRVFSSEPFLLHLCISLEFSANCSGLGYCYGLALALPLGVDYAHR